MRRLTRSLRDLAKQCVPRAVVKSIRHFVNGTTEGSSSVPWDQILGDDGLFHWEDLVFDLRRDPITLFIRDEILKGGEYRFYTPRSCVVIDIGMNIGDTPLYFARMPHVTRVYAYEPIRETYEWALRNIALNPLYSHKITPQNYGISDTNQSIVCDLKYQVGTGGAAVEIVNAEHLAAIENASYILDKSEVRQSREIAMKAVDHVVCDVLADHPTELLVMKCDAEGAEWKIIPALERAGLLEKIAVLMLEYHYGSPDRILAALNRSGFCCFVRDLKSVKDAEIGNIYAVRGGSV